MSGRRCLPPVRFDYLQRRGVVFPTNGAPAQRHVQHRRRSERAVALPVLALVIHAHTPFDYEGVAYHQCATSRPASLTSMRIAAHLCFSHGFLHGSLHGFLHCSLHGFLHGFLHDLHGLVNNWHCWFGRWSAMRISAHCSPCALPLTCGGAARLCNRWHCGR